MRIMKTETGQTKVWASARDTYNWAHKPGASWPCSTLADRRLFVEFDSHGDLVDLDVDGGRGDQDIDAHELYAFMEDTLGTSHPTA